MGKDRGYVAIHRSLIESDLWLEEPFTRGQAWVDLISLANHKTGYFRKRGMKIFVQRGQVGRSIKGLADRWQWSQGKAKRFLKELEDEGQTESKSSNLTTLISIVNYDKYQIGGEQTEHQTESRQRADGEQTETYNKDKKDKNDNKDKNSDFVPEPETAHVLPEDLSPKEKVEKYHHGELRLIQSRHMDLPFDKVLDDWSDYRIGEEKDGMNPKAQIASFRRWINSDITKKKYLETGIGSSNALVDAAQDRVNRNLKL